MAWRSVRKGRTGQWKRWENEGYQEACFFYRPIHWYYFVVAYILNASTLYSWSWFVIPALEFSYFARSECFLPKCFPCGQDFLRRKAPTLERYIESAKNILPPVGGPWNYQLQSCMALSELMTGFLFRDAYGFNFSCYSSWAPAKLSLNLITAVAESFKSGRFMQA
jgi:hypothetical protein